MTVGAARVAAWPVDIGRSREALARRLHERLLAYRSVGIGMARPLLFGLVIACHVAFALRVISARPPATRIAENTPPLHVRLVTVPVVTLEQSLPQPPPDPPPQPSVGALLPAPSADTLPPRPPVEALLQPPPDLPQPVFVVPKPQPTMRTEKHEPARDIPKVAAPVDEEAAPGLDRVERKHRTVALARLAFLDPPRPVYPRSAQRAGSWGLAVVRTLVDVTGTPTRISVDVSSGHDLLDESAEDAVRLARFKPFAEDGSAQAVWVLIPIQFFLTGPR
jgi:protein TonB